MVRARILAVDDDPVVLGLLRVAAEEDGLDLVVEEDAAVAFATAQSFKPDLVILDVRLPGVDGFTVARRLHDQGDVAVLFLTAADTLEDRLAGFKAGGDDYLLKPFFVEEVIARIRAILRRRGMSTGDVWRVGDLTVDEGTWQVARGGCAIELTRTEFDLLLALLRQRGRVVPRAALAEQVWGFEQRGNVLDVHMSALRRKLEACGERYIHTVRSVGYVLRPPAGSGPGPQQKDG
jgi:two-component system OmpR family response regulator